MEAPDHLEQHASEVRQAPGSKPRQTPDAPAQGSEHEGATRQEHRESLEQSASATIAVSSPKQSAEGSETTDRFQTPIGNVLRHQVEEVRNLVDRTGVPAEIKAR